MRGETIKRIRLERGLTQEQLAELAGISQPHLSILENNQSAPSLKTAARLAKALGLSLDSMVRSEGDEEASE